uniref:Tumor protein p53-inducible protein 13 n=1 Tax=Lygus hesperus TaxID=30085 RepID=A0A0A9X990_LYGHE
MRDPKMISPVISLLLLVTVHHSSGIDFRKYLPLLGQPKSPDDSWTGRWFPDKPSLAPSHEPLNGFSENSMSPPRSSQDYLVDDWKSELNHMGQVSKHVSEMFAMDNSFCDDGKQNLTVDFPPDESHFVCHSGDRYIEPQYELPPILTKYPIPAAFVPSHRCMNVSIEYPFSPPTFGNHRPNWAKWGEYEYLPPQRWIHNLEHGGIVMLYNPCAHHFLVNQLREIVRNCLYKHVITPYRLSSERPLALIAWGWSLTMSEVDVEEAKKFIEDHANRGPEMIDSDGKYELYLKDPASNYSHLGQGICSKY